MLDVEGPMDPIDPPPGNLCGSKILLKMLKNILLQEGHFVKVRSRIGIKGT